MHKSGIFALAQKRKYHEVYKKPRIRSSGLFFVSRLVVITLSI